MKLKSKTLFGVITLGMTVLALMRTSNLAGKPLSLPKNATFTTLSLFEWQTEGLTGDNDGNFYTAARNAFDSANPANPIPCPVYRVSFENPSAVVVGYIPLPAANRACVTSGLAFNDAGVLFVVSSGRIYQLTPDESATPTANVFVTNVTGANGLAFDSNGNLWITQGFVDFTVGQNTFQRGEGRVWMVPAGASGPIDANLTNLEKFRVQPLRTDPITILGVQYDGIGRQIRSFPPGKLDNLLSARGDVIVANGIAVNHSGDLLIADTARGAIWKVKVDPNGNLLGETNCDQAFAPNTLCLSNVWVSHPLLEETDGIALDMAGNIWATANGRQAIVLVTNDGSVQEVFRNPRNANGLRNEADLSYGNNHILEFPSSPFLSGDRFCTACFDAGSPGSQDNFPNSAGEISPNGPNRGKISCMDQDLMIPGLPLPI
jgi:Gluconolactonase